MTQTTAATLGLYAGLLAAIVLIAAAIERNPSVRLLLGSIAVTLAGAAIGLGIVYARGV